MNTPTDNLIEALLSRRANPDTLCRPDFSLAWAAGFADGEGCIHVARQIYRDPRRRPTYRLRFSIAQNNREVLEHFQRGLDIAAGALYASRRVVAHNRQMYTLNYDGRHAMLVILLLLPHLVRKRPEAEAATAFWIEGRCGLRPGGVLPADVLAARARLYRKLRNLK
jgi:hypothetical protein